MQYYNMFSQFNHDFTAIEKASNLVNSNAILTTNLHTLLLECDVPEDISRMFWVNSDLVRLPTNSNFWHKNVYVYQELKPYCIVLTNPVMTLRVFDKFYLTYEGELNETVVKEGLIPILEAIAKMVSTDFTVDLVKPKPVTIEPDSEVDPVFDDKFADAVQRNKLNHREPEDTDIPIDVVARPRPKHQVIKDVSDYKDRPSQGWKKSYAQLREILEDYVLDESDYAVLPVMNADMLGYLKLAGGIYVDPLTDVQITHENHQITVVADDWKIVFNAKQRSGQYAIYGMLSSIDARYHTDLMGVAKVMHALNNLYNQYYQPAE